MNKFFATMAAVSALAIAAPAVAQSGYQQNNQQNDYRGNGNADATFAERIAQLQVRFQAGVRSGSITRSEAMPLRQQLRQLTQLERQYAANGISGQERGELQRRMRDVRQAIRSADGNNQARWGDDDRYNDDDRRYGDRGRDDDDGRYGDRGRDDRGYYSGNDRIDADRDGYDDRDRDRDGRWDDDLNDSRYQQQQPQQPARGGLGGIVDALLGRDALRAGQQAPGNLYGLQGGYRDQYRDGNGTFFRTDGRQIYQIDARTQTVVRVYPMNR